MHTPYKLYRQQNPKPHFLFRNIPPSKHLVYEKVRWKNHSEILDMFHGDRNPHVMNYYKDVYSLMKYINMSLRYYKYSPITAGCDWFFKLKETGEYLGVLNVYDLSIKKFRRQNRYCRIGYATKESARRKGYASEAVRSLTKYIFKHYDQIEKIIASIEKDNNPSLIFIKKQGFKYSRSTLFKTDGNTAYELARGIKSD